MPWEHKPGQFALFKNQEKKSEKAPDYRGNGMNLDGQMIEVAAWLKDGKNGKFMSCQIKPQGEIQGQRIRKEHPDEDIPF